MIVDIRFLSNILMQIDMSLAREHEKSTPDHDEIYELRDVISQSAIQLEEMLSQKHKADVIELLRNVYGNVTHALNQCETSGSTIIKSIKIKERLNHFNMFNDMSVYEALILWIGEIGKISAVTPLYGIDRRLKFASGDLQLHKICEIHNSICIKEGQDYNKDIITQSFRNQLATRDKNRFDIIYTMIEFLANGINPKRMIRKLILEVTSTSSSKKFSKYASSSVIQLDDTRLEMPNAPVTLEVALSLIVFSAEEMLGPEQVSKDAGNSIVTPGDLLKRVDSIREIIPSEVVSPVRFYIQKDRLKILNIPLSIDAADHDNVVSARKTLQHLGDRLLRELRNSNADKRVIDSVEMLQSALVSESNIIHLGILNIGGEAMCQSYQHELPDPVAAMFRGLTMGITLYIGQFDEWSRFVDNAASVDLTRDDARHIGLAAQNMSESLRKWPDIVDDEVPAAIMYLSGLIDQPSKDPKRIIFANLRTIENFVSRVYTYALDDLVDIRNAPFQSREAVNCLVEIAAAGAATLAPVISKLPETKWMGDAAIFLKSIAKPVLLGGTRRE